MNSTELSNVNLSNANLFAANLSEANLSGAKYTKNAKDIRDTIWPEGFDPDDAGQYVLMNKLSLGC